MEAVRSLVTLPRSAVAQLRRLPWGLSIGVPAGVLVVCALSVGLWASPAAAETAAQAIAQLNVQRAANGIPAGITERTDWSSACAQHNNYQQLNGGGLTHDENPALPGYTPQGAWAGQNSVLHVGSHWTNGVNPWENAPIHLHQLLAPRLAEMGVDDSASSYVCATTWPGMTRAVSPSLQVTTYPGNGRSEVWAEQTAREGPFVPGDFVGLPQGTTTGPNMLIFADGPGVNGAQIVSADLFGPNGPVPVRWVDKTTATIGPYLSPGGVVIPVSPLRTGSVYVASVTVQAGGTSVTYPWSFKTQGLEPPPPSGPETSPPPAAAGQTNPPGATSTGSNSSEGATPPSRRARRCYKKSKRTGRRRRVRCKRKRSKVPRRTAVVANGRVGR